MTPNDKNLLTVDRVTTYGVIFLTFTSFVLSYDAIRQLAVSSGVNPVLSWLYPLSVDAVAMIAAVTVLRMTKSGDNPIYPWIVTVLFAAVSVLFNILHFDSGSEWYQTIVTPLAYTVHAIPPIAVMLGFHLLILQKENDIRRDRGQAGDAGDIGKIELVTPMAVADTVTKRAAKKTRRDKTGVTKSAKVTERQQVVLSLLENGYDAGQIAGELDVSERTIKRDLAAIQTNGRG